MWNQARRPRVLIQGISGREAQFWTQHMLSYGTHVVAGVTPARPGIIGGVPAYRTVQQASKEHEIDCSIIFVPPTAAVDAVVEAMEAHISDIYLLTEGIPVHNIVPVLQEARTLGIRIWGPNSPGMIIPGKTLVGILPGWLDHIFRPGPVALISRSGSLATAVSYQIVEAGLGQSLVLGIGGDPVIGVSFVDALRLACQDSATKACVLVGEPGGVLEQDAAAIVPELRVPVIGLIVGQHTPPGKKMGHAGAIVERSGESAASKIEAFKAVGVQVAETILDVPRLVASLSL